MDGSHNQTSAAADPGGCASCGPSDGAAEDASASRLNRRTVLKHLGVATAAAGVPSLVAMPLGEDAGQGAAGCRQAIVFEGVGAPGLLPSPRGAM
jgi:hypothetical protein